MYPNVGVASGAQYAGQNVAPPDTLQGILQEGAVTVNMLEDAARRLYALSDIICGAIPRSVAKTAPEAESGLVGGLAAHFRSQAATINEMHSELTRIETRLGMAPPLQQGRAP